MRAGVGCVSVPSACSVGSQGLSGTLQQLPCAGTIGSLGNAAEGLAGALGTDHRHMLMPVFPAAQ